MTYEEDHDNEDTVPPVLLKLYRLASGHTDGVPVKRPVPSFPKSAAALDSVSCNLTARYLPLVESLIAEDTQELLSNDDPVTAIGGREFMQKYGDTTICSLREIQSRLKAYQYRVVSDVSADIMHLLNAAMQAFGSDQEDMRHYVNHLYAYYRKMSAEMDEKPSLMKLMEQSHPHTSCFFDRSLYLSSRRAEVKEKMEIGLLKDELSSLQNSLNELVVHVSNKRAHDEEEARKRQRKMERQQSVITPPLLASEPPTAPRPKANIYRGSCPPPQQPINHLPQMAAAATNQAIEERHRKRAFSRKEKVKLGDDMSSIVDLGREYLFELVRIAEQEGRKIEYDEEGIPVFPMDNLSTEILFELQQYVKAVKHLTKKRGKPGRKPKAQSSLTHSLQQQSVEI